MKLINCGYDKNINLLLQFSLFIESHTHTPLALYQLQTVPVPIKDNNTEANFVPWLQPRKGYLATEEENYISVKTAELSAC